MHPATTEQHGRRAVFRFARRAAVLLAAASVGCHFRGKKFEWLSRFARLLGGYRSGYPLSRSRLASRQKSSRRTYHFTCEGPLAPLC